jgi:hypothetical protein
MLKTIILFISFFIFTNLFSQINDQKEKFYGINLNQGILTYGCSKTGLAIDSYNSIPYGYCDVSGVFLDSVDSILKDFFEKIYVAYKTDNPNKAIGVVGYSYIETQIEQLNINFYSVNNSFRKKFGNPTEVKELENGESQYLWENDFFQLFLLKYPENGNFGFMYSLDKNWK